MFARIMLTTTNPLAGFLICKAKPVSDRECVLLPVAITAKEVPPDIPEGMPPELAAMVAPRKELELRWNPDAVKMCSVEGLVGYLSEAASHYAVSIGREFPELPK